MTYIREADTAAKLQTQASQNKHKSGQDCSPQEPALTQQHTLKYPSERNAESAIGIFGNKMKLLTEARVLGHVIVQDLTTKRVLLGTYIFVRKDKNLVGKS